MTDQQHPIIPSPELVHQWLADSPGDGEFCIADYIATQAARWGADQELEACVEWLRHEDQGGYVHCLASDWLHEARRPKLPSLKEQAIAALTEEQAEMSMVNYKTIRTALESLPS